ncbi:hypothetical protein GW17_00028666 [Ensete ventricosum]|nr:hypothetical protein GW17_00028666 [Ensete ventricosum]RZS12618.1 hypothetical protein BHM03_00044086 [Ensete ventricosum]
MPIQSGTHRHIIRYIYIKGRRRLVPSPHVRRCFFSPRRENRPRVNACTGLQMTDHLGDGSGEQHRTPGSPLLLLLLILPPSADTA